MSKLNLLVAFVVVSAITISALARKGDEKPVPPVLNFTMKSLDEKDVNLAQYQGKVVMMVNTASKCGNTPQYKDLEALYKKYSDKGFVILGFPANDFGHQEPGSDKDIAAFCSQNYDVTFPMFSKVVVKGPNKVPLFKYLTENSPKTGEIKWNFEKFLIGRDGKIVDRFDNKLSPSNEKVVKAIESELAK